MRPYQLEWEVQAKVPPTAMSVILILMLASLAVALLFLGAFIWAARSGQFEDTETPSMRILMDDEPGNRHSPRTAAKQNDHQHER